MKTRKSPFFVGTSLMLPLLEFRLVRFTRIRTPWIRVCSRNINLLPDVPCSHRIELMGGVPRDDYYWRLQGLVPAAATGLS